MHSKGWLLKTNAGSPVRVVHDGKIIFANYLKGHGLLIIVSHGDGFMTLYAHNQFLLKKMGRLGIERRRYREGGKHWWS